MELAQLKCPACGADKLENRTINGEPGFHCGFCGLEFQDHTGIKELEKLEASILSGMGNVIDEALVRERTNKYYNLRSLLFGKITARYIDSAAILGICRDILAIAQHDFLAEFFEVANSGTTEEIAEYISRIDATENALLVDLVLNFIIKSLKEEYITPTAALLERCGKVFSPQKKQEFLSRFEAEAAKVAEGIYEVALERDVFLAYSSKDMPAVIDLLNFIESQGLSCFAAFRNLQHGRDAVMNYERALEEAIDHCSIFVFVSSANSRSFSCDAFKKEMPYIRNSEMRDHREYRSYEQLPEKYRKLRIEYRLDNKPTPLADRTLKEFFAGLTYAEDYDQLVARLGECMDKLSNPYVEEEIEEPTPAPQASANPFNFGDKESFAEMIRMINAENKRAEEEARRKVEEELKRKAEEEAQQKALLKSREDLVRVLQNTLIKRQRDIAIAERKKVLDEIKRKSEAEAIRLREEALARIRAEQEAEKRKAEEESKRRIAEAEAKRKQEEAKRKMQEEAKRKAAEEAERKALEAKIKAQEEALARQRAENQARMMSESDNRIKQEVAASSVIRNGVLEKYSGSSTTVIIPDGVTTIKESAFKQCSSIQILVIGKDVTTIESFAFDRCSNLTSVSLGKSVKLVSSYAFSNCEKLTNVDLGGTTEVKYQAFSFCRSLKTINIPATLKAINGEAFSWCRALSAINVDPANTNFKSVAGILYTKDGKTLLKYPPARTDKIFNMPESVTELGPHAIESAANLTTINLPSGLKRIDSFAFDGCTALTSISLPSSLENIGNFGFCDCKSLTNLTIPARVNKMGIDVFKNTPSLNIYIHPDTNTTDFGKNWHGGHTLYNSITRKPFIAGGLFKKLFKK